jgi:acetyltransferase-like isoleucine patch superfamily enzyme
MMIIIIRKTLQIFGKSVRKIRKIILKLSGVTIGKGGLISMKAHIDSRRGEIIIGDNVSITAGCIVLSHSAVEKRLNPNNPPRLKTIIGDRVFIGVNSVILPGVQIGNNAIIGAGAVVTKDIPEGAVAVGNPARIIRYVNGYSQTE